MDDHRVWEPDEDLTDNEDLVAGMTGDDGHEILRDDLETDQMLDDADATDELMEDEFGE